jgi:hypothetical protein
MESRLDFLLGSMIQPMLRTESVEQPSANSGWSERGPRCPISESQNKHNCEASGLLVTLGLGRRSRLTVLPMHLPGQSSE